MAEVEDALVRVVFDTNVIVSAFIFGGRPRALLMLVFRGELTLVTSAALMDELEGVLVDRFAHDRRLARALRHDLELVADVVIAPEPERVARDRDDDVVLATALAGTASIIVTGDRDLLTLGAHRGIRILTPSDLAARLM